MTPREFYREGEAAQQRWQDAAERDLSVAWHTAVFAAQAVFGKLPSLTTLLDQARRARQTQRQSIEDLGRQLTGVLGIPGRPASPAALAALRPVEERRGE